MVGRFIISSLGGGRVQEELSVSCEQTLFGPFARVWLAGFVG